MAQYGNVFVDVRYENLLSENLFKQGVMFPGITYSTRWQGNPASGAVKIPKLTRGTVVAGAPAGDFTNTAAANTLITLALDKRFPKSYKIYGVQAASVDYDMAQEFLNLAVQEVLEGWNATALLELGTAKAPDITSIALTGSTVHSAVVAARKALVDAGARPNAMLVSTATYAALLASPEFIRASDLGDRVLATGQVGTYLGIPVFETAQLPNHATGKPVQFVLYDIDGFAIATNLEAIRIIDSENFVGSLAQVEINSGFKVVDADKLFIHGTT